MATLGLSGLVGLILGILAVAVIRPLTSPGAVLLIVLFIAAGVAVGGVVRSFRQARTGSGK